MSFVPKLFCGFVKSLRCVSTQFYSKKSSLPFALEVCCRDRPQLWFVNDIKGDFGTKHTHRPKRLLELHCLSPVFGSKSALHLRQLGFSLTSLRFSATNTAQIRKNGSQAVSVVSLLDVNNVNQAKNLTITIPLPWKSSDESKMKRLEMLLFGIQDSVLREYYFPTPS